MKKFFKALALILALTLLVGAIPVSAADDGYEFYVVDRNGKKIKQKTLYIGEEGSHGKDKEGKECPSGNMYDLTNHVYGFDAETMDLKLRASKPDIISTWNQSDRIYAKKIGTTTLTISVYSKDNGKKIGSCKLKVVVKKNAEDIVVIPVDSKGELVTDPSNLACNELYTITLTRRDLVTAELTDTDRRALTCEDTSVEITSINPPYDTQYTVKFTKAGTFKLVATTYQSTKYDATLLSKDIEVKAGYTADKVEQSGLDAVKVTFTSAVQGLSPENFDIYYLVNGDEVRNNEPKKVECKDEFAIVTFYNKLNQNQEYFVKYDGKVVGSFTSYIFDKNSAKNIVIPNKTVEITTDTEIPFTIVDEHGIEIQSLLGSTLDGNLEFTLDPQDSSASLSMDGNKVKIYATEVGKTYTINGKYTWYNEKGDLVSAPGSGTITTIAVVPYTRGSLVGVYNNDTSKSIIKSATELNGDVKSKGHWALGDDPVSLQIAVPYTKNGSTKYETLADLGAIEGLSDIQLRSANDAIVMVSSAITGSTIKFVELKANQTGSTAIQVFGKLNGNEVFIGSVPVTVEPGRATKDFDVTSNKSRVNIATTADFTDEIVLTVVHKDQYGDTIAKAVKVEQTIKKDTIPSYNGLSSLTPDKDGKITIKATDFTLPDSPSSKSINLKFSVDDSHTKTLVLTIDKATEATSYQLSLSTAKLDIAIKNGSEISKLAISLLGENNGFSTGKVNIKFVDTAVTPDGLATALSGSSADFVYTISKDNGSLMTAAGFGVGFDTTANELKAASAGAAKLTTATDKDKAEKLPTGTYVVKAYKTNYNATTGKYEPKQVGNTVKFVVEDNKFKAEISKKDNALSLGAVNLNDNAEIAKAFTVKFAGDEIASTNLRFDKDVSGDGKTAFVKSVSFEVGNDKVGYETITVDIKQVVRQ